MSTPAPKLWEFWLRYKSDKAGQLRSPRSRTDYEIQVGHFCTYWLAEIRPYRPPNVADLSRETISAAMAWLSARGAGPPTVNKLRRVLVALANHAADVLDVPPLRRVAPYKEPRREPSSWRPDQFGLMLDAAARLTGNLPFCSRADFAQGLLWFQYNSGARISACFAIRWSAIDLFDATAKLVAETQKNYREQTVTLFPETVEALAKLRVANLGGPFDVWPFDRSVTAWPAWTLLFRKIVYAALIDRRADPNTLSAGQVSAVVQRRDLTHKVRRTFATEVARTQGIAAARELLGHSSEAVTERYIDRSKIPERSQRDILPRPVAGLRVVG